MAGSKEKNYWTWKDSEVMGELDRRGVAFEREKYRRVDMIRMLKQSESKVAHLIKEELDEEGNVVQVSGIKELQAQQAEPLIVSRVIFHNTSEQGLPYVPMGHNGCAFYVPIETEVDVPDYLLQSCIKDAVEDRMYPEIQMNGMILWKTKRVQRFPYTVVKPSFPCEY
jgi:hypothetical protein